MGPRMAPPLEPLQADSNEATRSLSPQHETLPQAMCCRRCRYGPVYPIEANGNTCSNCGWTGGWSGEYESTWRRWDEGEGNSHDDTPEQFALAVDLQRAYEGLPGLPIRWNGVGNRIAPPAPEQHTLPTDIQAWLRNPVKRAWIWEDRMVRETGRVGGGAEGSDLTLTATEIEEVD